MFSDGYQKDYFLNTSTFRWGTIENIILKTALNSKLKIEGKEEVDPLAFAKELKNVAQKLGIPNEMLIRSVNEGFSGGEKKRFEILQMSILKPFGSHPAWAHCRRLGGEAIS